MLVFEERRKPEYLEKNLSEQRREPTTNSTHIWRRRQDLNPGYIGGRRVLSPLRHPLLPDDNDDDHDDEEEEEKEEEENDDHSNKKDNGNFFRLKKIH